MRRDSRTPIWPHVTVVVILFILCVLAPRSWQATTDVGPRSVPTKPPRDARTPGSAVTGLTDQETGRASDSMEVDASDAHPSGAPTHPSGTDQNHEVRDLGAFSAPRAEARVSPPVGERIDLDPSISVADLGPTIEQAVTLPATVDVYRPGLAEPATVEERRVEWGDPLQRTQAEHRRLETALPRPAMLIELLRALTDHATTSDWAQRALAQLELLEQTDPDAHDAIQTQLAGLRALVDKSFQTAARMSPDAARADLLRASYALLRRVDLWERCQSITSQTVMVTVPTPAHPADVARWVAAVERHLQGAQHRAQWREYLLLDEARRLSDPRASATADARRDLARRILRRIESTHLNRKQIEFFEQPPYTNLVASLKHWVSEPIDYARLLEHIERYEVQASAADARAVAEIYQLLRWSPSPKIKELAEHVNSHYRNANIRLAISGDLINRLLPAPQPIDEDVNDMILGARVFGHSRAMAQLRVVLVPDRWRWRLGLEAQGEVASETESRKGPARFFNRGRADYRAHKLLLVDRSGAHLQDATADAESESDLTDIRTQFDSIPLLNRVVRAFARRGYDENRLLARWETDSRVRDRVRGTMNEEVEKQLERVETAFSTKVLAPLHRLELNPLPVAMETTEQRLIVRYRLAGERQLAAYTPRPQAPSNSLFSAQIHESALNNVFDQLDLDGRTANLRELLAELAAEFGRPDLQVSEDIPDDVRIRFEDAQAVRIRFANDRIEITVRVAELSQGQSRFKRFWITTSYSRVASDGLGMTLVRDGIVSVGGVGFSDRFPLRAIFGRVFSKEPLVIVNDQIAQDPRLAGCQISLVARDGWLGAALTPPEKSQDDRLAQEPQKAAAN